MSSPKSNLEKKFRFAANFVLARDRETLAPESRLRLTVILDVPLCLV